MLHCEYVLRAARAASACRLPGALRRQRGTTLLEIMAVLALVSLLGIIAFPRFRTLQDAGETRSAARGLLLAVMAGQQRASFLNRPVVAFFPDTTRVAFYADLDLDGAADLPAEAQAARFPGASEWSGYPAHAVPGRQSFVGPSFPTGWSGSPQLTLRSDGGVSAGGSVRVRDARGTAYRVDVSATGAIRLSREAAS